MKAPEEQ